MGPVDSEPEIEVAAAIGDGISEGEGRRWEENKVLRNVVGSDALVGR